MVSRQERSRRQGRPRQDSAARRPDAGAGATPGRVGRGRAFLVRSGLILPLALGAAAAAPWVQAADSGKQVLCEGPATRLDMTSALGKRLAAALADRTLTIVAFGSSSTQGHGASSPDRSYPVLLAKYLQEDLPGITVTVLNRGVGGDVTETMLDRMQRDVIDSGADLVLWQTGTNDAIRGVPLATFATLLDEGLRRLAAANIGVVLLDPQYYPGVNAVAAYQSYVEAMAQIATNDGVGLFHRYALLRELSEQQPDLFRSYYSADSFHHSDAGYDCLARTLADSLAPVFLAR